MRITLQGLVALLLLFTTVACGNMAADVDRADMDKNTPTEAAAELEADGAESDDIDDAEPTPDDPAYTSAYICPMHCAGSGSEEPGQCPACGMDYVVNEEHDHDH